MKNMPHILVPRWRTRHLYWWPRRVTWLYNMMESADETLSTTEQTQWDPPQGVVQHHTPPTHHQQEYKQPMALLQTNAGSHVSPDNRLCRMDSLACSLTGSLRISGQPAVQDGPTRLQLHRTTPCIIASQLPRHPNASSQPPTWTHDLGTPHPQNSHSHAQ